MLLICFFVRSLLFFLGITPFINWFHSNPLILLISRNKNLARFVHCSSKSKMKICLSENCTTLQLFYYFLIKITHKNAHNKKMVCDVQRNEAKTKPDIVVCENTEITPPHNHSHYFKFSCKIVR